VTAGGRLPDGTAFERAAYLVVEAQVETTPARAYATVGALVAGLCLVGGLVAVFVLRVVRRGRKPAGFGKGT
jgi:hypothetical protein